MRATDNDKTPAQLLRECQATAQRHHAPLFDVLLARILVRGAFGFDVSTEQVLIAKLAVLEPEQERLAA